MSVCVLVCMWVGGCLPATVYNSKKNTKEAAQALEGLFPQCELPSESTLLQPQKVGEYV